MEFHAFRPQVQLLMRSGNDTSMRIPLVLQLRLSLSHVPDPVQSRQQEKSPCLRKEAILISTRVNRKMVFMLLRHTPSPGGQFTTGSIYHTDELRFPAIRQNFALLHYLGITGIVPYHESANDWNCLQSGNQLVFIGSGHGRGINSQAG